MERNLIQDAERIQELTNDRIPFDRACWIALYIQRITSGMSHEEAIRLEGEEHAERGNTSPNLLSEAEVYKMKARRAIAEMEQPSAFTLAGTPRIA